MWWNKKITEYSEPNISLTNRIDETIRRVAEAERMIGQLKCDHAATEVVYDAPGGGHSRFDAHCHVERCKLCDKDIKHLTIDQATKRTYEIAKEAFDRMESEKAAKQ